MIWSFKNVLKGVTLDFSLFTLDFTLDFEDLLLVYVAYPLRFPEIDLFFISKIVVFEIERWL